MARHKEQQELFCRSCGVPIKKTAEICPHCGVSTASFPGFEPRASPTQNQNLNQNSSPSSVGAVIERLGADAKMRGNLGPLEPYTSHIAIISGIILSLYGISSLLSTFVTPGSLIMGVLGSMLMVAGGVFAFPQVREELRPTLAENGFETPLDPGIVMYISLLLYIFGWLLTL